jgi:hypothetical protein
MGDQERGPERIDWLTASTGTTWASTDRSLTLLHEPWAAEWEAKPPAATLGR